MFCTLRELRRFWYHPSVRVEMCCKIVVYEQQKTISWLCLCFDELPCQNVNAYGASLPECQSRFPKSDLRHDLSYYGDWVWIVLHLNFSFGLPSSIRSILKWRVWASERNRETISEQTDLKSRCVYFLNLAYKLFDPDSANQVPEILDRAVDRTISFWDPCVSYLAYAPKYRCHCAQTPTTKAQERINNGVWKFWEQSGWIRIEKLVCQLGKSALALFS